jgi:bla regulator protein BlaR1
VTAFIPWGAASLIASAMLMIVVLAVRSPVRRWVGPTLAYGLWAIPAVRLILPTLPGNFCEMMHLEGSTGNRVTFWFTGPTGQINSLPGVEHSYVRETAFVIWLVGSVVLFSTYAVRHFLFCRKLRAGSNDFAHHRSIHVITADVEGPLSFGVFGRVVAVPRAFTTQYDARERDLALAHEFAHHRRGDLIANWVSLVVLAVHWWNPIAWLAIRAFREDQEFATDAHVLAATGPTALPSYAQVLVKAAGIGALPASNLNTRSNLKGRLMTLNQKQRTSRHLAIGIVALVAFGGAALAATATKSPTSGAAASKQAVTIVVKPDGRGNYALVLGSAVVAPGTSMPGSTVLPADFKGPGGCDLNGAAKPSAMLIKGSGETQTYSVMCASAAPAPVSQTLTEGLTSLKTMRNSVATQAASTAFPETERAQALGAIDRSIREVEAALSEVG